MSGSLYKVRMRDDLRRYSLGAALAWAAAGIACNPTGEIDGDGEEGDAEVVSADAAAPATEDAAAPDAGVDRWEPENPTAWFSADDGASLTLDGDEVVEWRDRAGNFDAVEIEGTDPPTHFDIGEHPSVFIDEVGLILSESEDIFRNRDRFAVFAVYRPEVNQSQGKLVFYDSLNTTGRRRATLEFRTDDEGVVLGARRDDEDDIQRVVTENTPVLGEPLAQVNEFDHADDEARVTLNGAEPAAESPLLGVGPTSDTATQGAFIGTPSDDPRSLEQTHVYEIVVYHRIPDQAEIDAFFDHARDHWGVDLE